MNKYVRKAVLKAVLTDFELAAIAGLAVIIADMTWLTHDIVSNGFSGIYAFIGFMMFVGFCATIAVIIRHNVRKSSTYLKQDVKARLKVAKNQAKQR